MVEYIFGPSQLVYIPVKGVHSSYAVNRIFCVGQNYAAHAEEMGNKADKANPFYFTKSAAAYVPSGSTVPYAAATSNLHFEMELVVALGETAKDVTLAEAPSKIFGYACGLDMTRRDLQAKAKEKRRPWDTGKDFENSAVISPITPVSDCGIINSGEISLKQNGVLKQHSDLGLMINSVSELIADLSKYYTLGPGDLIMTGTPEGVGPVEPGDTLEGYIEGVGTVSHHIEV